MLCVVVTINKCNRSLAFSITIHIERNQVYIFTKEKHCYRTIINQHYCVYNHYVKYIAGVVTEQP